MRGSRASESTSGVEREPGEVHASRRPQRASSSTKARRPRYVSVAGIVCGLVPADLVLLHGFTQTGASWDGVVRELAGRYRALAPDLGAGPWEAELDRLEALAPPALHARRLLDGRAARAGARAADPGAGAAARAGLREPRARRRRRARRAPGGRRGAGGRASRRSGPRRSRASGRRSRCSPASRRRSPPPPTRTACAAARPSTPRSCAGSAPA